MKDISILILLGTGFVSTIIGLVGKIVFDWLKTKRNGKNGNDIKKMLEKMAETININNRRVEDLHEWHNHELPAQPGVKIWWNTVLASAIKEQQESTQELTKAIAILTAEIKKSSKNGR